jgi:ketosteroid isomerase-like protein
MTQDNVEVARRFVEAFNLGLDDLMACYTEDAVHVTSPEWPEAGTYRGQEAVRGFWASLYRAQEQHVEVDELVVLDEHRVLSKTLAHIRGTSSGVTTTTPVYSISTVRGGLISRIEYFMQYEQALEAAGLSE